MFRRYFGMCPEAADASEVSGGIGGGTGAPAAAESNDAGNDATLTTEGESKPADNSGNDNASTESKDAEIARLKAALAKSKSDFDKAAKEAGDARKALKAKMTAEEIAAQEKEAADEAQKNRIIELEKQVARVGTVKSVMGKLGLDEDAAGSLADCLYGATDIDNALLNIQKAWQAKEKALRQEFGKITAPGAGADSNSPEAQAIKRAQDLGKERKAVNEQAQKAMNAYLR